MLSGPCSWLRNLISEFCSKFWVSLSDGTCDQAGMSTEKASNSGKSEIALCLKGSTAQYKAKTKKRTRAKVPARDVAIALRTRRRKRE